MQIENHPRSNEISIWLYGGLVAAVLLLMAVGYAIFWQFAAVMMPRMAEYTLLALAIAAGVASFFSPCAFPLLPGYLGFYAAAATERGQGANHRRTGVPLLLGLSATAGVVAFSLLLAASIGLLGAGVGKAFSMTDPNPSPWVLWLRAAIGITLLVLGLLQWTNVSLKPGWMEGFIAATRPQRTGGNGPHVTLFLYGFGYTAAGIGCTGPILAGLTLYALSTGGRAASMATFGFYSATMGALMLLISLLVGGSHSAIVQRMKANTVRVKQVTSVLLFVVGLFTLFTALYQPLFIKAFFPKPAETIEGMVVVGSAEYVPPVLGLYEGGEVLFIHTEVSDPEIAAILTEMMGPAVIVSPELAQASALLLARVYVFANGISGSGPLGFQPDLFDTVPGDAGYRPLRRILLVTWAEGATPRLLASAADIELALASGEIAVEETNIVVNMPILSWPGGER